MAADQHVYCRQEGAAKEEGDPGNDELATTGYGHGIRLLHGMAAHSGPGRYL